MPALVHRQFREAPWHAHFPKRVCFTSLPPQKFLVGTSLLTCKCWRWPCLSLQWLPKLMSLLVTSGLHQLAESHQSNNWLYTYLWFLLVLRNGITLFLSWDLLPLRADLRQLIQLFSIHLRPYSFSPFPSSASDRWPHSKEEWVAVLTMEDTRETFLKDMLSEVSREPISSLQFVTTKNSLARKCCYFV